MMSVDPKLAKKGDKYRLQITGFVEKYEAEVVYMNANGLPVMKVLGPDSRSWPLLKNDDYILEEKI